MADTTREKRPLIADEIATAAKDIDIFAGWLTRLENPDPVLLSEAGGEGIRLYDQAGRDAHTASVLQTRALAVVGKEWEVLPPETGAKRVDKRNQDIADFVKRALVGTNFDQWRQELLKAVLYGFNVAEVIWKKEGDFILPQTLRAKHPRRFVFTPLRELRILTPQNMVDGEAVPDRKFVVFTYGSSDNPYGAGLGQIVWFPVWFKKHGVKFWMMFLEKFGMPTTIGKYPPGTDPAQQQKLMDALSAIQNDTAVKVPNTMQVELLEASRSGTASYGEMCEFMDKQISKAVLGQTLTTEVGDTGSYAASQTHDEVRGELIKADADLLCECLNNSLVRWIVDLNFPGVTEYPKLWIRCEAEADLKSLAERDKILSADIGLPVPKRYLYETYSIPEPEAGEETVGKSQANEPAAAPAGDRSFAEAPGQTMTSDQMAVEGLKNSLAPELPEAVKGYLDAVREAVEQSQDFDEAKSRLMASYTDMDDAAAADLLARALFAADVWGRING